METEDGHQWYIKLRTVLLEDSFESNLHIKRRLLLVAARQPSSAKTLLHDGPAQGTYSRGLMANGQVA